MALDPPLSLRAAPDGGRVLALPTPAAPKRPAPATLPGLGLLRWCAAIWHRRRIRREQRQPLRRALRWMAASGAITPAIYGRRGG